MAKPTTTAADAFLILEFIAGNRLVPHSLFTALLVSLPSVKPHSSQRLRAALALRALDAALSDCVDAPALLHKARAVLADADLAPCFPRHLSAPADADASPAAAVADLKRLLEVEWASLPPSTLEIAADRIAGDGALHTWGNADHTQRSKLRLLVGESTEREILSKLQQSAMVPEVDNTPQTDGAKGSDSAQDKDKAGLVEKNAEADRAQEYSTQHQQVSVQDALNAQLKERVTRESVRAKYRGVTESMEDTTDITGQSAPDNNKNHQVTGSKHSLMERNPTASTYEWDGLGESDAGRPAAKRQLPTFEKEPKPSPTAAHKTRKKWSEIQEKTLLEGVEKYGKGNWKDIKMAYPDVFDNRSTVDLKDKFRNMERYMCV